MFDRFGKKMKDELKLKLVKKLRREERPAQQV